MPVPAIDPEDTELLECGCNRKEALVEAIYVELGIIGKEIAEKRKSEGNGWKALGKPERQRILMLLDKLGKSSESLLELLPA
jgi:hypothetical protein